MSDVILRPENHDIARLADATAAQHVFDDYRRRKADNTTRRQDADLALFEMFLNQHQMAVSDLNRNPRSWASITWGLVTAYVNWMLAKGYAIGSINVRLSTVKTYAKMAFKVGAMDAQQFALIQTVQGYRNAEAIHIDEDRPVTSIGTKKTLVLSDAQVNSLKTAHPDTEQGKRDRLLMCLLLDHGLRVSEASILKGENIDGELMTFWRPKVSKWTTHRLTDAAFDAYKDYPKPADEHAPLLRWSLKSGNLAGEGITPTGISDRVRMIGVLHGIDGLSAHDCRHSWATRTARLYPKDPFGLQEAGGWNSLTMPRRYVEAAQIANERVRL